MISVPRQPTMMWMTGFGWAVVDLDADRSYWYDMRPDSKSPGMHYGFAASAYEFCREYDQAAAKATE